jgi:hypothetical protein
MKLGNIDAGTIYNMVSYEIIYSWQDEVIIKVTAEIAKEISKDLECIYESIGWDFKDTIETLKSVIEKFCHDGTISEITSADEGQFYVIDATIAYYFALLDSFLK